MKFKIFPGCKVLIKKDKNIPAEAWLKTVRVTAYLGDVLEGLPTFEGLIEGTIQVLRFNIRAVMGIHIPDSNKPGTCNMEQLLRSCHANIEKILGTKGD